MKASGWDQFFSTRVTGKDQQRIPTLYSLST